MVGSSRPRTGDAATSEFELCVLGLGYVGLPMAAAAAVSGLKVLGVDCNPAALDRIANYRDTIVEHDLRDIVEEALSSGRLALAPDAAPAHSFVIAVPTPITQERRADLSYVTSATRSIVPHLRTGCSVILESTVPVGTTEDLVCPILAESGLDIGTDVFVAFCPERVLPGNIVHELRHTSRLIGGVNEASAQRVAQLYARFVASELIMTNARTAEMAKLVENTYRDVNIALANELAAIAEDVGVDVWEVIELANRHPRVNILKPGPGVGGHCIPVDPYFIIQAAPEAAPLLRAARAVNDQAPARVAEIAMSLAGTPHPTIAVLGVTYKGNVDDTRGSPVLAIIELLRAEGAEVSATDPHATGPGLRLRDLEEALHGAHLLILAADHDEYHALDPHHVAELMVGRKVLDARGALDPTRWRTAGFKVYRVGSPLT